MADLKLKGKDKITPLKDILDTRIMPERFYVSKIGVMKLIIDREHLTTYQVHPKDAPALCKLMNDLDLGSKL